MVASISYQDWSDFLYRIGAVCAPEELQGMLCGTLCGGLRPQDEVWIDTACRFMDLPADSGGDEVKGAMTALYELTLSALQSDTYDFRLLLPEDALPLPARSEALAGWCQGFLHGLGSAGDGVAQKLDDDGQGALRDVAQIAQVDPGADDAEENEVYFVELVEYARMAAFDIFAQLNSATKAPVNSTPTH